MPSRSAFSTGMPPRDRSLDPQRRAARLCPGPKISSVLGEQFLVRGHHRLARVQRGLQDFPGYAGAAHQLGHHVHVRPFNQSFPRVGAERFRKQRRGLARLAENAARAQGGDRQGKAELALDQGGIGSQEAERAAADVANADDSNADRRHEIPILLGGARPGSRAPARMSRRSAVNRGDPAASVRKARRGSREGRGGRRNLHSNSVACPLRSR